MNANEYNVGDLIEAVKGESSMRGPLIRDNYKCLLIAEHGWLLNELIADRWTVTVIKKAAPVVVLPTEEGTYLDIDDDVWRINRFGLLECQMGYPAPGNPENYAPFTRLEPVSVTAKKVLDRVDGYGIDDDLDFEPFLKNIAKEFGVEL